MESSGNLEGINSQAAPEPLNQPASIAEKMVPQSEVNRLIGSYKQESYEKGKQDGLASSKPASNSNEQNSLSREEINRMIEEKGRESATRLLEEKQHEFEQARQQEAGRQLVEGLYGKIDAAKDKFPELSKKVEDLELHKTPALVGMIAQFDNAADILDEFHNNPSKFISFASMSANHRSLAQSHLQKLSDSIRNNKESLANTPSLKEPHRQISSSVVGTGNGSLNSVTAIRQNLLRNR